LTQEIKQVIVVRSDLAMGKGKLSAQVAHAAVLAAEKTRKTRKSVYKEWTSTGQAKVVVKVNSLDSLMNIQLLAETGGLVTAIIEDMGLTQLPPETVTCVGIGPDYSSNIDKITSSLKLL
tara:strand:+ start:14090 stop:14449 length:360 start_codon:yes stop_codon:yes gene_type:complete